MTYVAHIITDGHIFVTQRCQNCLIFVLIKLYFRKVPNGAQFKIPDEKIAAPHKKKRVQSGHLAGVGAGD